MLLVVCVCVGFLFCFVFLPLFFQYCFQFARFHLLVWGKRSLNVLILEISNSLTMLVTSFGSVLWCLQGKNKSVKGGKKLLSHLPVESEVQNEI